MEIEQVAALAERVQRTLRGMSVSRSEVLAACAFMLGAEGAHDVLHHGTTTKDAWMEQCLNVMREGYDAEQAAISARQKEKEEETP